MKLTKIKNKSAITLIALVITILVLLILAGVALSLVVGEDGITEKAIKASKTYDIAGAKEQVDTLVAGYATEFYEEKYISGNAEATNIANYIAKQLKANESTVGDYEISTDDTKNTIVITNSKNGNTAKGKITEDGKVEWGNFWEEGTETVEGVTKKFVADGTVKVYIGDFVNYDPTIGKDGKTLTGESAQYVSSSTANGYANQTFSVGTYKSNGYGWRVFGVENGQIVLIASEMIGPDSGGYENSSYPGTTYYGLYGNVGYENGVSELDKIGALYGKGKYATRGRSINVDDINKLTGFDPKTYSGYGSKYTVNGTEYTNTYYWYDIAEKLGSDSVTKSLLLGENPGDSPYGGGGTYYFTNNGAERRYWLGSQCVDCDPDDACWGLRYVKGDGGVYGGYLAGSDGGESYHNFGVLPVVSLQSDIQLKQGSKSGEWSFVN